MYSPKKDLCDKCLAHKNKQMQLDVYNGNGQIKGSTNQFQHRQHELLSGLFEIEVMANEAYEA